MTVIINYNYYQLKEIIVWRERPFRQIRLSSSWCWVKLLAVWTNDLKIENKRVERNERVEYGIKNKHNSTRSCRSTRSLNEIFDLKREISSFICQCKKQNVQSVIQLLIQFHNRRLISASIAIIWSREYCHDILLVRPIVPFHNLMLFLQMNHDNTFLKQSPAIHTTRAWNFLNAWNCASV